MPFMRHGKKADKMRNREARQKAQETVIDQAVGAARVAINNPGLCLPMCVLCERILAQVLPSPGFSIRLGSLHVSPEDRDVRPIAFDPRTPDGIEGGFHAWLEDRNGQLLDPSIFVTLHAEGFDTDAASYLLVQGRCFALTGLRFVYEELPELELLGLHESEPQLARLMALAMRGEPCPKGTVYLDVGWRNARSPGT